MQPKVLRLIVFFSSCSSSSSYTTMSYISSSVPVLLWCRCPTFAPMSDFLRFLQVDYRPSYLHNLSMFVSWLRSTLWHLESRRCCECLRCRFHLADYPFSIFWDFCKSSILFTSCSSLGPFSGILDLAHVANVFVADSRRVIHLKVLIRLHETIYQWSVPPFILHNRQIWYNWRLFL